MRMPGSWSKKMNPRKSLLKVWMPARLVLRGRQSGIVVDRVWQYVFTVRDGKLLRQDGYDDETEARAAAGLD